MAKVDINGAVLSRIEIGTAIGAAVDPKSKRGPRGLALHAAAQRLYVLNRISNTLSVVDTGAGSVLSERPVGRFDPTPAAIRNGRGFLYDAKLSGNGTGACAGCHVDSEMDLLAWDLGNPGGNMQTVTQGTQTFQMHPMKGPMTTQTLKGLNTLEPFHWRGDRADFLAFNPAFDSLMGGAQLSPADMAAYRDFVNTLRFSPNPNQKLDRTLPASLAGGDPNAGRNTFLNEPFTPGVTCNSCHLAPPGPGSNRAIIPANLLQEPQNFKVPHLRNLYQKLRFDNRPGAASIGGFGFIHDGSIATLFDFLSQPVFQSFATDSVRKRNLSAFLQAFDTGMAPAVGYARTVTASNGSDPSVTADWNLLEQQAAAANIDLIVKGTIDGQPRGLLYQPATNNYKLDRTGAAALTRAQLGAKITAGDVLTPMGVPPGSGVRMGIDRDADGVLDADPTGTPPSPTAVMHPSDISTTDANGVAKSAFKKGQTLFWRVRIVDQNNSPVAGALVTTDLLLNNVMMASQTASTGSDGWAIFSRTTQSNTPAGTYTIRVNTVTKSGTAYDPSANVKSTVTLTLK